jgi:hypothetical protein
MSIISMEHFAGAKRRQMKPDFSVLSDLTGGEGWFSVIVTYPRKTKPHVRRSAHICSSKFKGSTTTKFECRLRLALELIMVLVTFPPKALPCFLLGLLVSIIAGQPTPVNEIVVILRSRTFLSVVANVMSFRN